MFILRCGNVRNGHGYTRWRSISKTRKISHHQVALDCKLNYNRLNNILNGFARADVIEFNILKKYIASLNNMADNQQNK